MKELIEVTIGHEWIDFILLHLQTHQLAAVCLVIVLVVAVIAVYCIRHSGPSRIKSNIQTKVNEVKDFVGVGDKPRFRKRDKVMFYGRKMLRKVKSMGQTTRSGRPLKKRHLVMKFAKKLLQRKKQEEGLHPEVLKPPREYLQENFRDTTESLLPPEVLYMLRSIRVFGHFDTPVFLELCKHMETVNLKTGQYLFKVGDSDENIFVVQTGRLNVFITEGDMMMTLKYVDPGDSITSLLSFCDVLTGHPHPYKTVCARATEDSIVLKLPVTAFQEVFERHPETFVRVVQIIMIRLMRVTCTALHHYLGLSAELINPGLKPRAFSIAAPSMGGGSNQSVLVQASPHKARPQRGMTIGNLDAVEIKKRLIDPSFALGSMDERISEEEGEQADQRQKSPVRNKWRKPEAVILLTDEESLYKQEAIEGFQATLGLPDDTLLKQNVHIRCLSSGATIMKDGSYDEVCLVYVLSGSLIASQHVPKKDGAVSMFVSYPRDLVGSLAVLSGEPSFFTFRARTSSIIGVIDKDVFYSIMSEHPRVVLHVANTVIRRMSAFVRQIDFALDWMFLEAGRALYRQGEKSDCTYIVLSGRLRSVITNKDGRKELVGEYGRGDLVGIVELLTLTDRSTTVMAVRDTELAKLPDGLLNAIKVKHPIVVSHLIELLGHRILGSWKRSVGGSSGSQMIDQRPSQTNLTTVAIIPVTEDVPLTPFTLELFHALTAIGKTLHLTSELVRRSLGPSILEAANEYRLTTWLAQQEDQQHITLYQCDPALTPWTLRCLRQADCILIVAMGDKEPSVGKIEKELGTLAIRTQKELILLHKEGGPKPSNTVHWLNMRSWCSSHHHIQCPKRMFTRRNTTKMKEIYARVLQTEPNIHSDFSRLGRLLTGTSVGLVLGGGGAKGAAHVGMIKAIQETGIPIDMVGGVSIGAFIGALYCKEKDVTRMTQVAREWSRKMTQVWRQVLDLTYPITSWFSGAGFNYLIREALGETQIEDLWLPYFTITTDISNSSMRVHTHGSLWRYVRGSMSLSGYMPPMCDPRDGHLLLDGGYVNNLPADVMRTGMGAHTIIAIDVGAQDEAFLTNYGDCLSGWWLLWKRWNPFASAVKVPSLPDIQQRLAYVSCVRQLEEVKSSDYCEYIRPPIDRYKTLQFGSFEEIREVGYHHGSTYFAGMRKAGTLSSLFEARGWGSSRDMPSTSVPSTPLPSAAPTSATTFTDLAQMVCRVQRPDITLCNDVESDEDYDADLEEDFRETNYHSGYHSEPALETGADLYSPTDEDLRAQKLYHSEMSGSELLDTADSQDEEEEVQEAVTN